MKKLLCLFLTLPLLLSVMISCGGKKDKTPEEEKPASVVSWVGHSYDKLRADLGKPEGAQSEYTVYMAKGETEGCHMGVYSEKDLEKLRFKVISGKNDHITQTAYNIRPILKIRRGQTYTDPAVPFGGARFSLEANTTFAILLEFTTTPDTPAGDYEYEFGITDSEGNIIVKNKVTVHVWDFEMPEKKTFQTSIGLSASTRKPYIDLLLEHNLSCRWIFGEILSGAADEAMSDPRVTSFCIQGYTNTEENIVAVYEYLKKNPEWMKKAFFYPLDEPRTVAMVKELEQKYKYLSELCPGIKIISPYYTNVQMDSETDQIGYMASFMTTHCPKLSNWDDAQIYSADQAAKYDSFADRMKALKERGDTIWAYVCNYPEAPYLNVKIDEAGLGSRVLFWQMYQRDIDGFLYWNSTYYDKLPDKNPWKSVNTNGDGIYGDGILFYPGDVIGTSTPIVSIRMKLMRDGVDDIELLYMAEELLGKDWVDERASSVSKSLTTVDVTSDQFAALRIEIGNAIEAKLKNN